MMAVGFDLVGSGGGQARDRGFWNRAEEDGLLVLLLALRIGWIEFGGG